MAAMQRLSQTRTVLRIHLNTSIGTQRSIREVVIFVSIAEQLHSHQTDGSSKFEDCLRRSTLGRLSRYSSITMDPRSLLFLFATVSWKIWRMIEFRYVYYFLSLLLRQGKPNLTYFLWGKAESLEIPRTFLYFIQGDSRSVRTLLRAGSQ
jgi:hypothetical protein